MEVSPPLFLKIGKNCPAFVKICPISNHLRGNFLIYNERFWRVPWIKRISHKVFLSCVVDEMFIDKNHDKFELNFNFTALFYGWGSTALSLEPLGGGSLLFTNKFPEISDTNFLDLGRMKAWFSLGATQWFWTWDPWIVNLISTRLLLKFYIYEHWNQDCYSKYKVTRQISFPGKRKRNIFRFKASVCFSSWVIQLLYFSLPLFFSLSIIEVDQK